MLSKKSQRNGAHYIKDLRTTGPWRVNGVVIGRKKKANKANDSDAMNDSARAKSHTRNKPLLTGYKKRTKRGHSITGLPPLGTNLKKKKQQQILLKIGK